jgi:hypothetical protein
MRPILTFISILLLSVAGVIQAQAPRWGFLGDDDSLKSTFTDAKRVVLVCVYDTELRDIKPPFAEVVYLATVIESQKGELETGDKIQIGFKTDSLPLDEAERLKFVENANKASKGALKFAFLHGAEGGVQFCEFLDVPNYTKEMHEFLKKLKQDLQTSKAEQGESGQPATSPESKPEGGDKPQPESEERSR